MKSKSKEDLETSLRLLAKSSIVVFIALFLSKILAYIYRIVIARFYGPEVYGLFTLALMVIGFVGAFASLGLTDGLLRYIPLYRGKKKIDWIRFLYRIAASILLITSIASGALLYVLSDYISVNVFHNAGLTIYLQIFSFLIPISILSNLFLSILRAYEKIGWHSFIFNIIQSVVKVLALLIFIYLGISGIATVYSQFIATTSVLIFAYIVAKFTTKEIFLLPKSKGNKKILPEVFSYSWPIIFVSIVYSIFYWVDSFAIGFYQNVEAVGFYNAAVPIALLLSFVPELFMQLFFPMMTREYGQNRKTLIRQISKQVGKWIFMFNLPILLLILIFPGVIINLLFGAEYLVAENALRLLTIGAFLLTTFTVSQNLLSMAGKSKIILVNIVAITILNIILNMILVPIYGITGAAFSTMISFILLGLAFLIEAAYYLKIIPIRRKMINTLFAALIALSVLFLLRSLVEINLISIFLISITFLLVYFLLLLLFRSFDKHDLETARTIERRLFGRLRLTSTPTDGTKNI